MILKILIKYKNSVLCFILFTESDFNILQNSPILLLYLSFFFYFFIFINILKYFDATKYCKQADGDGLYYKDVLLTSKHCLKCNKLNLNYNGSEITIKIKN